MGVAHLSSFAYVVSVASRSRTYRVVVARVDRSAANPSVRTRVVVAEPRQLRGSSVLAVESRDPGAIEMYLKLPPMSQACRIDPEHQIAVLPLVNVGYLDFLAYRHPGLTEVSMEPHAGRVLHVFHGPGSSTVVETTDASGRVVERTTALPGRPVRRWTCTFPPAGVEAHLASTAVVAGEAGACELVFRRSGVAVAVPPEVVTAGCGERLLDYLDRTERRA